MCNIVVINKGEKEIETPRQFLEHFGFMPEKEFGHNTIEMDYCLCQCDCEKALIDNKAFSQTSVSSSVFSFDDFDKLMNTTEEPQDPINMPKDEFLEKSKKLFKYISDQYFKCWKSKRLTEEEYPEESVCDKCTGCGTFKFNGEDNECVADREEGECYVRYFDAEEFGLEIEATMDDVYELLFIDNIE